jgi:hypothetical protein
MRPTQSIGARDQSEMSQSIIDVPMVDRKGCTRNLPPPLLAQGVGSPEGGVGKSARKIKWRGDMVCNEDE